ncbi:MAG TPA: penicillin-binding protein 2 [Conexibacter sp.]|jgi:penicillin-binding protein 2
MIDPEDRRAQSSPQLAMRVAILGGIAFAIFGIIFFRLWFLQVLSGDQYVAQASSNRVRTVVVQAPRGEMTDRNGNVLVENRSAVSVVVTPQRLPQDEAGRHALLRRLSWVLGRSTRPADCQFGSGDTATHRMLMPIECAVDQSVGALPYADVVVQPDASKAAYTYLSERAEQFPGVSTEDASLREYPYREVGAQLFGTVGQIDADQLRDPAFRGIRGGSIVGKGGLEGVYDHYLRGVDGEQRIQVNAQGQPTGKRLPETLARKGNDLKLSIDLRLEQAGQQALKTGEDLAHGLGNPANGGAFVALDPRDGEVLGMGSDPSFDPNIFAKGVSDRVYRQLNSTESNFPLFNRATQGTYAVGSTFKPVTSAAALSSGVWDVNRVYDDIGTWRSGDQVRRNAGGAVYGPVDLTQAIAKSVDTFFYNLGGLLNVPPEGHPNGGPLQEWARKFGFGRPTGVDLAPEADGTVPDPHHIRLLQDEQRACERRHGKANCNIAFLDDTWTIGDNASLAIGQGDFLASPLQLAVAYGAIENGGTVVRPHIGLAAIGPDERVIERFDSPPARRIDIPDLPVIQQGLRDSTLAGGTSADVFAGFGKEVFGKTGTAQITGKPDQSWYVAYVPDPVRPIVVACVIQNGGFGDQAAAPAVRQILSQWFYGHPGRVVAGSSTTT